MGVLEKNGISGPTSMTDFELKDGCWTEECAELQNWCINVMKFLSSHPNLSTKVEITRNSIKLVV
ncbi:hypothetical protein LQE94_08910 [Mediterraneibacter sp. NSJ-151]|uniref:hypothetical protein n=1 Tax=Mediterraneibacter sp. NSJ-151 TaxID=2897708 RepID=UPI001F0B45A7|nr:hypothetical protein [Mediterraneibacter sp. NSJ-151]MCH4280138.1 hypothetical protein [Mediterraneibacter sp. NSJ-151]